ncbi:hypothetical protein MsAg5_00120 [Methanosarcinaceae archaeon Ag5]|uniref:Uncharacterized protein n=1 Tax=Methanolapillus africanus TaxID=3028297 RepID=A0AAE4SCC2_9EURY|nr:hypothetical protein [Methanosarcinaceae archaeon Ag5]
MNIPINTVVLFLILIGIVVLQVFLSRRENKWLGLVLPALSVLFSLFTVFGMYAYVGQPVSQIVIQTIMIFLMTNIPTVILLVIYAACRESLKKKKEIDKMSIQDLD